jgi:hypothetical protein
MEPVPSETREGCLAGGTWKEQIIAAITFPPLSGLTMHLMQDITCNIN